MINIKSIISKEQLFKYSFKWTKSLLPPALAVLTVAATLASVDQKALLKLAHVFAVVIPAAALLAIAPLLQKLLLPMLLAHAVVIIANAVTATANLRPRLRSKDAVEDLRRSVDATK